MSHNDSGFGTDAADRDETARVLEQFRVLGLEREQEFDRLTRLACSIFNVPMAAIGFVDGERFRFRARQGFNVEDVNAADSLCMRCIRSREACIVQDTLADPHITTPPRTEGDALLRFYAGVPLSGRQRYVGTFCLMDVVPHSFDEAQLQILRELGSMVDDMLELRLARLELRDEMSSQRRMAALLRAIIDNEPECVKVVSADGALLDMNPAGLRMIEAPALDAVSGQQVRGLVHPDDRKHYLDLHRQALAGEAGKGEFRVIGLAGTERWMESHSVPLPNADGEIDAVLSLTRDVSLVRREAALRALEAKVLDLISANASLEHILTEITLAVDRMLPDFRASVLLVDGECLRHGAAPHLPDGFNRAIDGIAIAEGWGGCGTAAFRRQTVIASDIAHDPLFRDFHALAREYRIGACWSTPVLDPGGAVLATFALYSEKSCTPDAQHLDLIARISQFVRIAIERKRQYEHLHSSEERYRTLFDLVPVAILEEDWSGVLQELQPLRQQSAELIREQLEYYPELLKLVQRSVKVLAVNQAALDIFEADDYEHLVAAMPEIFNTPDLAQDLRACVTAMLEGKSQYHGELRLRTARGGVIHALTSMSLPEPGSQSGRVTLSVMDITARKEAEQRFRIVAQTTSDVVWDWSLLTDQVWWNPGLHEVFGYPADLVHGSSAFWLEHIHPDDHARVETSIRKALANGERWREEYRFQRADGSYVWVADQGAIIRSDEGRAMRMIGSMVDISEQRLLQEQLRQSQRLDAIGQLTGGVAHDFNNLLTVILGNAEMLAESLTDDQRLRMLADVTAKAAERAAELTSRLLAFARRQPLEPKATDINRQIAHMDSLLRRSLGEHVEIELVRGGGLWKAMVDPGQLENALLNLCINARDAMPQGGRLTIETANTLLDSEYVKQHAELSPGRYVMIAVSDTGTGMDKETMQKAFEPFFTTKEVGKGSGLGLSMVYGFIKQSFGHIRIYSEPGEGTTIRLYLPRADRDEEVTAATVGSEPDRGSERILLVEDDDMVREHVHALLLQLGYRVVPACNGKEALELLDQAGPFDLLFTDVVMPGGISGRQLADLVRARYPDMPVLYTSGYTENAIVHHGRLDTGVVLLQKPFRRQELAEKVRLVLRNGEADSVD